jgi:hypothetical protein
MLLAPWLVHLAVAQQVVYPTHVGDRWEYTPLGVAWISSIVADTLMPNGKLYTVRTHDYHWLFELGFDRQEGNKVYRYDARMGEEHLWYDFDLSPGERVNSFSTGFDTTDIYLAAIDTITIFGVPRRSWAFFIDNARTYIDDEQSVWITDSLGMTDYGEAFGGATLQGALIDGRGYGSISGVKASPTNEPASFRLSPNYPNPFNPSTTITYAVPFQTPVTLKLFNLLGQEVATLVDAIEGPGSKSIRFDARDLPGGVYFYRLQAGSYSATKKLMIVK